MSDEKMSVRHGIWRQISRLWGSSLPLRMIIMTMVSFIFVLLLGGFVFIGQAKRDLVDAKSRASAIEASSALNRMQNQLNYTDLGTESMLERLGQLAVEVGDQPRQFSVVIETTSSVFLSRGPETDSVPQTLKEELDNDARGLLTTLTEVPYTDSRAEPAVVVGGHLYAPSGQGFPVYFIFPAGSEQQTLEMLQQDLISTGAFLSLLLAIITYLVSKEVTKPLRSAGEVSRRIADGDLYHRMVVKGTDELASLATSLNNMASELQRKLGQLEDLSRVQQQFVSDVSHELRTPLTTIRMATDVLHDSRDQFSSDLARSIELLHDQEERFESMLGDLLEISRFDAGAATLDTEEIDLADLVRSEIRNMQAMGTSVGSQITLVHCGSSTVEADARRVRRVVRNLLANAINHGEHRAITVSIAADDQAVALTVRDRGHGFLPEHVDQVFRRFWRADESRNRGIGGTGLGLAIALEDTRLHHGWLDAWGMPGQGALLRLTLPRNQSIVLDHSPLAARPSLELDTGRPTQISDDADHREGS